MSIVYCMCVYPVKFLMFELLAARVCACANKHFGVVASSFLQVRVVSWAFAFEYFCGFFWFGQIFAKLFNNVGSCTVLLKEKAFP